MSSFLTSNPQVTTNVLFSLYPANIQLKKDTKEKIAFTYTAYEAGWWRYSYKISIQMWIYIQRILTANL